MTQRYYISRVGSEKTFNDLEAVREAAEHLANSNPGDEVLILKVVGTSIAPPRHATTTWIDKPDAAADLMRASTGWSWPPLPHWHSYLNPENLTVEQLGDGWRPLCTLDETYPIDHQILLSAGWAPGIPCGFARPYGKSITYRTRAPIPALPSNP